MRAAEPTSWFTLTLGAAFRCLPHGWTPWLALAFLAVFTPTAKSAPLLLALQPEAPQIVAAVPEPSSGIQALVPRTEKVIENLPLVVPARYGLALDASGMEAALLLDPSEEGREAVAQTLQESALVRRILGSTLAIIQPGPTLQPRSATDGESELAVDDPGSAGASSTLPAPARPTAAGGAAAPPRATRQRPPPDTIEDVSLVQDDGPTLRTVARSLISVRRPEPRQQKKQTVVQSVATAADDLTTESFSLTERLLDSRMLGDVLQTVFRPYATYGPDNSFSILGQGRFELELDFSSGLGNINVAEATTGASLSVTLETPLAHDEEVRPKLQESIDIIGIVLNFLSSATGMFMMILAGCLFLLFAMFRFALGLRR